MVALFLEYIFFFIDDIFDVVLATLSIRARKIIAAILLIIGIPMLVWSSLSFNSGSQEFGELLVMISGLTLTFLGVIFLPFGGQYSKNGEPPNNSSLVQNIRCPRCKQLLHFPTEFTGLVGCPQCSEKIQLKDGKIYDGSYLDNQNTDVSMISYGGSPDGSSRMPFGLRQNQLSFGISLTGGFIGLFAVYLFLTAFSLEARCPEENQEEVIVDGEPVISCSGSGMWSGTLTRLFFSCCMFVPLSALLTILGKNMRNTALDRNEQTNPEDRSQDHEYEGESTENFTDSSNVAFIQSLAQWFGGGLLVVVIILSALITVAVILGLYAILTSDGFFA